jgi:hypothetical protein
MVALAKGYAERRLPNSAAYFAAQTATLRNAASTKNNRLKH